MVIQPDARLAQHAQKGLLGAEFRMVVAADVGHPAGGLAQPPRLAASRAGNSGSVHASSAGGSDGSRPSRGRQLAPGGQQGILRAHLRAACAA